LNSYTESERPKILLVEDDADMRAYLRAHLEPHYDVLEAARGDDGLQAVQQEMPDVIVADILMPGLDGYALCRTVKSNPETDFIPLILLTTKADAQSKLEGLEGGADDYTSKPFDPTELLLRIRNLLLAQACLAARLASAAQPRAENPPARVPDAEISASAAAVFEPSSLAIRSVDAAFSNRVRGVLERESQQASLDVETLAARLNLSRTHLHRRTKDLFGLAPSELIIRFRLERAAKMLSVGAGTVGQIAYAVGFKNLAHFSSRFREQYGQTPAAYAAAGNRAQ